jgi:tRNA threonylcarbamoyladenosine biosynthesis protein TsaE
VNTQTSVDFISQSPDQTFLVGEHLGTLCQGGEVIWLSGALGCGKTALAQGIARGLGIQGSVTSPTFTVLKEYQGRLALFHFDFYRFEGQERAAAVEFADYRRDDAVCAVEWAEHAADFLPDEYLLVKIGVVSPTKRALQFQPRGARYERLMQRFQTLAFRP